jgi:hypothetical protein
MYTSFAFVVLGALTAVPANSLSWHGDYDEAYRLGSQRHKPLAVFLGKGPSGWQKVVEEGQFNAQSQKLLRENYVCVYLDTTRSEGAELAGSFEMRQGTGLVLSDHTGKAQAFRHEGSLSGSELEQKLRTYADRERVVQRTETDNVERVSNYAPLAPVYTPTYVPQAIPFGGFGGFGGGGGGGC